MLLAFVAGRRTPTNVALAAAAPSWVDACILTPARAADLLGRADAAVGRLDIADALDGVEDGLWASARSPREAFASSTARARSSPSTTSC